MKTDLITANVVLKNICSQLGKNRVEVIDRGGSIGSTVNKIVVIIIVQNMTTTDLARSLVMYAH